MEFSFLYLQIVSTFEEKGFLIENQHHPSFLERARRNVLS
jgi:hypothetical protein